MRVTEFFVGASIAEWVIEERAMPDANPVTPSGCLSGLRMTSRGRHVFPGKPY